MQNFDIARENMIFSQLRPSGISSPALIAAIHAVPREQFVPRHLQRIAYVDEDIDVGGGRFLSEPIVLARLLQALDVEPGDVALDIGCGTGYCAALLAQMAATVVAIEENANMAAEAERLLRTLDICNVAVIQQKNLPEGYPAQAPYHKILINGSVADVPEAILSQLADGGRLVTVLSNKGHMGSAVLFTRTGDSFSKRVLFDAATPTLSGFEQRKSFDF
jgi:protein-L-isoaspartate(D-aspartate) O-methyltransferase